MLTIAPAPNALKKKKSPLKKAQRDALLTQHLPIVRIILSKMRGRLPANADLEELHSAGVLGLVECAEKFDPQKGYTFETFASFRVRGAIQDSLRNLDMLSRTARQKCKRLVEAENTLSQSLGRLPTETEIEKHLGLSSWDLRKLRRDTAPRFLISLHTPVAETETTLYDNLPDDQSVIASHELESKERATHLFERLEALPYRLRKVLHLYYFEGLKLSEIAYHLEVSEARISQLRTEGLNALRESLAETL